MKYRNKPVEIEAIQWLGSNANEISSFCGDKCYFPKYDARLLFGELVIITPKGHVNAIIGDYIIKNIKGEFFPCGPNVFETAYEKVGE